MATLQTSDTRIQRTDSISSAILIHSSIDALIPLLNAKALSFRASIFLKQHRHEDSLVSGAVGNPDSDLVCGGIPQSLQKVRHLFPLELSRSGCCQHRRPPKQSKVRDCSCKHVPEVMS